MARPEGDQPALGEDPNFTYGAFITNTGAGQMQYLDARHRTQAHVEDRIKELKACGAARLPSTSYRRNSVWLHLAAHAVTVLSWLRLLALDGDLATAEPETLRFPLVSAPAPLRLSRQKTGAEDPHRMGLGHLADAFFERAYAPCTQPDLGVPVHPLPPSSTLDRTASPHRPLQPSPPEPSR